MNASATAIRIAGVDPELGFGGGEAQVMGLTAELVRMGHRAELICDPAGKLWERARRAGFVCHPLRIHNSIDLSAGIRLRNILKHQRYDVVHFHTARAHAMAPYGRGYAHALVVTRRMDYRPNRLFAPYLFNQAVDGVAAISRGVADALAASGVPRERITIIPSGVDCDHFRPPSAAERADARAAFGIPDDTLAIGTVGVLESRKGHRYLLQALAGLASENRAASAGAKTVCLIAGDGSLHAELEREAAELGLSESVRLLGRIEDSRSLLWALDIFAFPSLHEGLGVAMLEAAACGLACVASDTGGLRDLVVPGQTGLLAAAGNPAELAAAIRVLAGDLREREAMGAQARARVASKFDMAKMAERTLELYRACLEKRGAKGLIQ
ncbi:MAG TPA: glycosyltransferase family 4 protein [Candidatus Binataceae bacterium]|nr:glycosyltransferase family 4 protein [Candidatus Binataceae bacterium]